MDDEVDLANQSKSNASMSSWLDSFVPDGQTSETASGCQDL